MSKPFLNDDGLYEQDGLESEEYYRKLYSEDNMQIEKMSNDEFNLVNMIVKQEKIITNESMIVRVQRLHKELAINCSEWEEDFIKLMLELNEIQLTSLEGFLLRNHIIER